MPAAAAAALVAVAVISSAATIYSTDQNRKTSHEAQDQAKTLADRQLAQAEEQAQQAEEAANKANARTPNTNAILSAAQQAAKNGISGTMLTGSSGVSPDQLTLGKSTLLGS